MFTICVTYRENDNAQKRDQIIDRLAAQIQQDGLTRHMRVISRKQLQQTLPVGSNNADAYMDVSLSGMHALLVIIGDEWKSAPLGETEKVIALAQAKKTVRIIPLLVESDQGDTPVLPPELRHLTPLTIDYPDIANDIKLLVYHLKALAVPHTTTPAGPAGITVANGKIVYLIVGFLLLVMGAFVFSAAVDGGSDMLWFTGAALVIGGLLSLGRGLFAE